ncbi:hypothetical protein V5F53_12120 [Xanthobacter sp. V4C-4]|uniref:hypothetical protein n=1 Tax=Xanthobacter cornucopiae TaxID=3119924 RepID=UPI0037281AA8
MDLSIILPLLVALIPIALFFALVQRHRAARPRPPAANVSEPGPDFGLDRDTDSESPMPAADTSSASTGAAAAAAGGALILGYGASHRSEGGDRAPDRDGGGQDGPGGGQRGG